MRKQILITVVTLLTSISAMAGITLRNGDYAGQTSDGRLCGLRVRPSEFNLGMTRIEFLWRKNVRGYEAGFVEVKSESLTVEKDVLTAKTNTDIGVAKVKVTLANDGSPLEVKMALGTLFKFGYDETCLELVGK